MPTVPITLAGAICFLMLLVQHYAILPIVRHIWRKKLPVLPRYLIGTLAMNGSLVVMFWLSPNENPVVAVMWVTGFGGAATMLAYGIDQVVEALARAREEKELRDINA